MNVKEVQEQIEHIVQSVELDSEIDVQYVICEGKYCAVKVVCKNPDAHKAFKNALVSIIVYRLHMKYCMHVEDFWIFSF